MKGVLLLALLIVVCVADVPTQLTYTVGQNYAYDVEGIVQNNGYDTESSAYLTGLNSVMHATMVLQATKEDDTSYEFVMNLFNTEVSINNNTAVSMGSSGTPLGEDVYFTQLKTGQITLIAYHSDDPVYYVNVKVGAINAFQTQFVAVSSSMNVEESDPVGNHSTLVQGSLGSNGNLVLTKQFNQKDVTAFPDPQVNAQNMELNVQVVAGVHPTGFIQSSSYTQATVFTNDNPNLRSSTTTTGLDMLLSATGSLAVEYNADNDLVAYQFSPKKADSLVTTGMFAFAADSNEFALANMLDMDITEAIATLLKASKVNLSTLTKIGNHLKRNPTDVEHFLPVFQILPSLDDISRDRVFFVLTVAQAEELIVKYGLESTNCAVLSRAVLAAPHIKTPTQNLLAALARVARSDCEFAASSAQAALAPLLQASNFPFNQSYTAAYTLGGKIAAVDFTADLFVGTNFNCNNPAFNYEGTAEATATAVLFGYSQQAFDAKITYGQVNGAALPNALTLSIWGKEVYNQPLPTLTCKSSTYPLAHVAPGFNVERTLWVSIIPVVFTASASLELSLTWGWNVCPTDLSASVQVNGNGQIDFAGSSYTDLILLRAGFDLAGSFNTEIIPQVYVHGTACAVGLEVDQVNNAMSASVTSNYQWRTCKGLFGKNCKWGKYNEQTWWEWSLPAGQSVLFKQEYAIKP